MVGGKESRMKVPAQPSAGARRAAGKTDSHEETLRKGRLPKAEAVREAKEDGANSVKACRDKQVDGNGNPKKRTRNYWGTSNDKEV